LVLEKEKDLDSNRKWKQKIPKEQVTEIFRFFVFLLSILYFSLSLSNNKHTHTNTNILNFLNCSCNNFSQVLHICQSFYISFPCSSFLFFVYLFSFCLSHLENRKRKEHFFWLQHRKSKDAKMLSRPVKDAPAFINSHSWSGQLERNNNNNNINNNNNTSDQVDWMKGADSWLTFDSLFFYVWLINFNQVF